MLWANIEQIEKQKNMADASLADRDAQERRDSKLRKWLLGPLIDSLPPHAAL